MFFFFFFKEKDGIRDYRVTGFQTCALPIFSWRVSTACLVSTTRSKLATKWLITVGLIVQSSPRRRKRLFRSCRLWLSAGPCTLAALPFMAGRAGNKKSSEKRGGGGEWGALLQVPFWLALIRLTPGAR